MQVLKLHPRGLFQLTEMKFGEKRSWVSDVFGTSSSDLVGHTEIASLETFARRAPTDPA
jgi:hypothetical protein